MLRLSTGVLSAAVFVSYRASRVGRLGVRLPNAKTGVLTLIADTSRSDDLFRVASEIGGKLRERMGVSAIEDSELSALAAQT
jgi:hypothetical protein